jgi:hypothetical protein
LALRHLPSESVLTRSTIRVLRLPTRKTFTRWSAAQGLSVRLISPETRCRATSIVIFRATRGHPLGA